MSLGNLAKVVQKWLKKGSKLYLSRAMKTRKWTDSHDVKRYVTEVISHNFSGENNVAQQTRKLPSPVDNPDECGARAGSDDGNANSDTGFDADAAFSSRKRKMNI